MYGFNSYGATEYGGRKGTATIVVVAKILKKFYSILTHRVNKSVMPTTSLLSVLKSRKPNKTTILNTSNVSILKSRNINKNTI